MLLWLVLTWAWTACAVPPSHTPQGAAGIIPPVRKWLDTHACPETADEIAHVEDLTTRGGCLLLHMERIVNMNVGFLVRSWDTNDDAENEHMCLGLFTAQRTIDDMLGVIFQVMMQARHSTPWGELGELALAVDGDVDVWNHWPDVCIKILG